MGDQTMNPFLLDVLSVPGGDRVLQCIQCGTCSGSCPVIAEMEFGPRRIMHLIQQGEEAMVLSSHDMWYCVSCYLCTNRCPREIQITDLMASLREMAEERGYAEDREADFGEAFSTTFRRYGRQFEPELVLRYFLRSFDIKGMIGMIPLSFPMVLKHKMPFFPERIEDPQEMVQICPTTEGTARAASSPRWWRQMLGGLVMPFAPAWGKRLLGSGSKKEKGQ